MRKFKKKPEIFDMREIAFWFHDIATCLLVAAAHTEVVLKKLCKNEVMELVLHTYSNVIIDIAKLAAEMIEPLTYFRKLGLAVAISRLHHT